MESMSRGYYRVPKRDLIVGVQVLLHNGQLQVAAGLAQRAALVREMAEMQGYCRLPGFEVAVLFLRRLFAARAAVSPVGGFE